LKATEAAPTLELQSVPESARLLPSSLKLNPNSQVAMAAAL
jgi:hypothetical protein